MKAECPSATNLYLVEDEVDKVSGVEVKEANVWTQFCILMHMLR